MRPTPAYRICKDRKRRQYLYRPSSSSRLRQIHIFEHSLVSGRNTASSSKRYCRIRNSLDFRRRYRQGSRSEYCCKHRLDRIRSCNLYWDRWLDHSHRLLYKYFLRPCKIRRRRRLLLDRNRHCQYMRLQGEPGLGLCIGNHDNSLYEGKTLSANDALCIF
jgi:hypothetical protein